jgi:hypothetical protein
LASSLYLLPHLADEEGCLDYDSDQRCALCYNRCGGHNKVVLSGAPSPALGAVSPGLFEPILLVGGQPAPDADRLPIRQPRWNGAVTARRRAPPCPSPSGPTGKPQHATGRHLSRHGMLAPKRGDRATSKARVGSAAGDGDSQVCGRRAPPPLRPL